MTNKFQYQKIAEDLRRRIAGGSLSPGDQLETELELSEHYRVNRMTLRKALDILEKDRLIIRQKGSGTYISRELIRDTDSKTIAYIGDTASHFYNSLYQAILKQVQRMSYRMMTYNASREGDVDTSLVCNYIDGADCVICNQHMAEHVFKCPDSRSKLVIVADLHEYEPSNSTQPPCYSISCNTNDVFKAAARYLLGFRHKRIALLSYPDNKIGNSPVGYPDPTRTSVQGFRAGLAFDWQRHHEFTFGFFSDDSLADEAALHDWLTGLEECPTAFICEGDFRAAMLYRVMQKLEKRIPEDVSILGTGNTPWAQMLNPPLTSVYCGENEIASLAVMLADRNEIPDAFTKLSVGCRIIARDSVAVNRVQHAAGSSLISNAIT